MDDFYYSPFPDTVLSGIFYYGMTEDDFRKAANEADWLHMLGELHIRHVECRTYCAEYLDSDEYHIEREVYSRISEVVKPYLNDILDNPCPFYVEFGEDTIEVELNFDTDYCLKYIDLYDKDPSAIGVIKGSFDEITDLIRTVSESFVDI